MMSTSETNEKHREEDNWAGQGVVCLLWKYDWSKYNWCDGKYFWEQCFESTVTAVSQSRSLLRVPTQRFPRGVTGCDEQKKGRETGCYRPIRYIKIQPKTIALSTRLWGITTEFAGFIPQSLVLRSIVLGWILIYQNWSICFLNT